MIRNLTVGSTYAHTINETTSGKGYLDQLHVVKLRWQRLPADHVRRNPDKMCVPMGKMGLEAYFFAQLRA